MNTRTHTQQPQTVTAARHGALAQIVGSVDSAAALTQRLGQAAEQFHLVAPQTAVGSLPEGTSVAISAVIVNVEAETYPIPGSSARGLAKVALDKIASASGVSWDPQQSRRLDDGRDPRYCHYRAVGHLRDFDGTTRTVVGEREIDVREDSPQVEAIIERCVRKVKSEAAREKRTISDRDADRIGREAAINQVRELRLHVLSHAETKARLRAVRTLGIRTSYSTDELKKPFVVAKLAWTGRTNDPMLRREFALAQQRAMLGANAALYGQAPNAPAALPQHSAGYAPPPVGQSREPFYDDEDGGFVEAEIEPEPQPRREAAQPAQQPQQQATQAPGGDVPRSGVTIPGGREKGVAIEEASVESIEYWAERIAKGLEDGSARYPEADQKRLDAMDRELIRRREGGES